MKLLNYFTGLLVVPRALRAHNESGGSCVSPHRGTEQSARARGRMHMARPAAPCFQSAAISDVIDVSANREGFIFF